MPVDLVELAAVDPEHARRAAIAASLNADEPTRVQLLTIAAEASIRVGAVADALELFDRAVRAADACGDREAGPLRVRTAAMTAASGDSERALTILDDAERVLGERAWLAWYHRGLIHHWAGRSQEALQWLDRAEPGARAAGDELTVAKVVVNRALAYAHIGNLDAATVDAATAEQLFRALGERTLATHTLHNRGWIAARAGDLAGAWRLMHEAASDDTWPAPPVVLSDRAELAHAAGLLTEASELADAASEAQVAAGDEHGSAATTLLRARIALDVGDSEAALRLATDAAAVLAQQGRHQLRAAAAATQIAARRDLADRETGDERVASATDSARAIADAVVAVAAYPWRSVRVDGLLAAGEIYLRAGDQREAARLFTLAGADGESRPDVHQHAAVALAEAARTGRLDDRRLDAAWAEFVARRRVESVYELRGDWGTAPRLLTRVALVPLLDRGDAEGAIRWLERLRSLPPAISHGERSSEAAAALRALWNRRRSTADDLEAEDVALHAEQEAVLEAELVDRARLVAASATDQPVPAASDLAHALGDGQLKWIIAVPSGAWSVTLTSATARVDRLDRDRFARESARLVSAMRLGLPDWERAAGSLDALVNFDGTAGEVVVLPVGTAVEDVPFGAFPSLRATRLRTCWSGAHWLSTRVPRDTSRITLAGTGVEDTNRELDLLADVWPGGALLRGATATCANILDAFASDTLVHVGAHGRLRRDNPLLSVLECADGPLYGYEITRAGRVPGTVLLWSCALGGARMPAGVGVAGWPAVLAGCGCNALIAATGALPSGPAPDLAVELHRGLARGDATDATLAGLRTSAESDDLAARAAAMLAVHGAG